MSSLATTGSSSSVINFLTSPDLKVTVGVPRVEPAWMVSASLFSVHAISCLLAFSLLHFSRIPNKSWEDTGIAVETTESGLVCFACL
jgi:hypothetical protein